ncbi:hypothetical protein [Desulfatibacillum aliphaticivorans]|uniref:hypothetical protein n=1 Tax=Desulfatibacillum aliphaticivorans TaxID=218208 RepID=UPI0012F753BD|nr:hypothetical protein [Desulfatibacillum aliphaticivorans]
MKPVKIIALALAVCMALGLGSAMAAYSLDLAVTSDGVTPKSAFLPGETVYMTISASNDAGAEEIAGAAFSLQYPADVLTGPAVDADGVAVDSSIVTSFSFSITKDSVTTDTHRQNTVVSGTVGTVYFAGAGISSTGTYPAQGADPELFTAKFTVRNDAVLGPFQVTLKPTELYNPDAGYGDASDASQTPEAVTVLVGANTPGSPEEFPVLLNTFAAQDYDGLWATDGDSIDDQWEMDNFGDLDTATDATDYDNDGYLDRYEQTSENNTNPKVQDQAWTLDNYDPATDNRGPYQVVTGDPSEPRAPAGESFAVNLEYYTTDSAVNLDGLELVINYDSTELTIDSIDSLIAASGSVVTATDVTTPASATYTITWTGAGDWTGGALPATLAVVNFTSAGTLNEGDTSVVTLTATPNAGYTFHTAPITYTVGPAFTLDVDGNGIYDGGTDGILLIRYTFGYSGTALVNSAVAGDCTLCTGTEIKEYLDASTDYLDVDGNGVVDGGTDGIILIRHAFGFSGATLINSAVAGDCTRCTAAEIEEHLDNLKP